MVPIDFSGKVAAVFGVANHRSLAWGIAQSLARAGARLALSYQGERLRDNVERLAAEAPGSVVFPCDVTDDAQIDAAIAGIERDCTRLDLVVHSVAFARKEDLEGRFLDTSREGWRTALEISSYSLVRLCGAAAPLMEKGGGGAVVTLTYMASQRVVPNYNVMGSAKAALEHAVRQLAYELGPHGIRINAISAGPVSTLSARGISGISDMLAHHREKAPLKRSTTLEDVGGAALFLLSDLAAGVTGDTLYVDSGYSIMGV